MTRPAFTLRVLAAACIALVLLAALPLGAQEGITRTELRRTDLTGSDTLEIVMTSLEAAPGAVMPRHVHHGDEVLYVLDGGTVQAPGEAPMRLEPGATLHFPRAVPHGGFTVIGDATIRVITVHVVDKGKPMTELVE
jgi:quercetin dioxygenase-like cupin family protein